MINYKRSRYQFWAVRIFQFCMPFNEIKVFCYVCLVHKTNVFRGEKCLTWNGYGLTALQRLDY